MSPAKNILLQALLIGIAAVLLPVPAHASVSQAFGAIPQVSVEATASTLDSFGTGLSTFNEVVTDISLDALDIATTSLKLASGPVHTAAASFYDFIYTFINKHI
jgi:hypothetical protein